LEQLGKYQLVRKIATGGMAEVWLAQADGPRGFSKQLVVKRILPHLAEDQTFVDMFLSEARLAAQLNHPNVVQIFDFGEADDTWFIAMEFIDGPSLRTLAKRVGRTGEDLPLPAVARFVAAACEGLEYAHNLADPDTGQPLGLVHRDISPDNILGSRNGAVKVVDFGIAKASGQSHHTKAGSVKGKLAYMPPEQLLAEPLDRRTDIYALGVVLYELLSGAKPHTGGSEAAMMRSILYEAPIPIREKRPDLPEALVEILDQALAKDREDRFASCAEMQGALERFIQSTGEIVGAPQLAALVAEWAPPQPSPGGDLIPDRRDKSPARGSEPRRQTDPRAARRAAATAAHEVEPLGGKTQTDGVGAQRRTRWVPLAAGGVGAAGLAAAAWILLSQGGGTPAPRGPTPAVPVTSAAPAPAPAPATTPPAAVLPPPPPEGGSVPPPAAPPNAAAVAPSPGPGATVPAAGGATPGPAAAAGGMASAVPVPSPAAKTVVAAAQRAGQESRAPAPVAAPVAVAAPRGADVEIVTDPPAQVYVNGDFVSASPARVATAAGRVQVRVFDSTRGVDKTFSVELSTGDNGRKVLAVASRPVEFRVTPWATVFVDGKKLGDTPFDAPVSLYEGKHKVKLVNPELGVNRSLDLDVGAGPNVVKARLDAD